MIALKTQSPAFWQKEFSVADDDLEYLHSAILETGAPMSTEAMALALIRQRCQREVESLRSELDKGPMYQPQDSYAIGQEIVFPALQFTVATVIGSRPGHDPARGDFEVIKVQFKESGDTREFASRMVSPHPLNRAAGDDGLSVIHHAISSEELFAQFGSEVSGRLLALLQAPEQRDFIAYRGEWLVRGMMAEIHVGHLNIAEAAIDMAKSPLSTDRLLGNLDLPAEIDLDTKRFSLDAAMSADERFVDVGWNGQVLWYLRSETPAVISQPPTRLQWVNEPFDRGCISPDLLALEKEILQAAGDGAAMEGEKPYAVDLILTYPHQRSGTLPFTPALRRLLPTGTHQLTRLELIDNSHGETIVCWINHELGYIAGLERWYQANQIPTGARIHLEPTKKSTVLLIDFQPHRMRREWMRTAGVQGGAITFGMLKRPIACEYDELMSVDHTTPEDIDRFVEQLYAERRPLAALVREVVPELIKLNPAGTVHAKTIFSGVNVFRRCTPTAVFAILCSEPSYVYLGEGLWSFKPGADS